MLQAFWLLATLGSVFLAGRLSLWWYDRRTKADRRAMMKELDELQKRWNPQLAAHKQEAGFADKISIGGTVTGPYRQVCCPAGDDVALGSPGFDLGGLRHALYEKPDSIGTEEGIEYLGAWVEYEFRKVHAANALNNQHLAALVVELKRLERFP